MTDMTPIDKATSQVVDAINTKLSAHMSEIADKFSSIKLSDGDKNAIIKEAQDQTIAALKAQNSETIALAMAEFEAKIVGMSAPKKEEPKVDTKAQFALEAYNMGAHAMKVATDANFDAAYVKELPSHLLDKVEKAAEYRRRFFSSSSSHAASYYHNFHSDVAQLNTFAGSDTLTPADMAYVQSVSNAPNGSWDKFGSSITSPELQRKMESCLQDQTDFMGLVDLSDGWTRSEYKFRRERANPARATFECEGQCFPAGSDVTMPSVETGKFKAISATYCVPTDDLEDGTDDGFDYSSMISEQLANAISEGIHYELIFGNGSAIENLVKGIGQTQTQGVAGSHPDWRNLIAATAQLVNVKTPKIYGSAAASVYLGTSIDANGQPINAISYRGDKLYVGGLEYVPLTRSLHTAGILVGGGPLKALDVNYLIGDLKKAYRLFIRKAPIVTRFNPVNGSNCVVFKARARLDGKVICSNAALAVKSL